jgi:uncharacterized Fe-S cluster protein YjdI
MTDPRNRQYTNGEITVFWVPSKCIHATTCFRELIEVFNPGRRPWVNMEGATTRRIIEVVNKCPTQALVWKYNKELTEDERASQRQAMVEEVTPKTISVKEQPSEIKHTEDQALRSKPTNIRIMRDGPVVVDGKFRIIGADGSELRKTPMTSFCRCGHSKSMPYCDGTHRKIGFSE